MEGGPASEQESSTDAEDSLRQRLVGVEGALKATEAALDLRERQLAYSEKTVARLDADAEKLRERIAKLEQGVIAKDDLMNELQESRSELEHLRELVVEMKPAANDKSRLEEELSVQREQLETLKTENEDLRQELQGKVEALGACNEAKDSAQRLADECNAELAKKKGELEHAQSVLKRTEDLYDLASKQERKYRHEYNSEAAVCQATLDELLAEQEKVKSKDQEIRSLQDSIKCKDEEIRGLQVSMESKDTEVQGLKDTIGSKEESLRLVETDLEKLTDQMRDKNEQLQSRTNSVAQLEANLANVGREKTDVELDLGFIVRLTNLSIRTADVDLSRWAPLLRSLRVGHPVEITHDQGMSRQTWSILPSWPAPEASEGAGSVSSGLPCLHASLDGLLLELYGHGLAEGDFPCNPCLQALCTLSALVERQGVAKASCLVLVLEKLEARLRGLEATSGYEGMVMLGLRYLAALVRSRMPGGDVPGLSAVEDSLDGMMAQADKCVGVIRHVSEALCSSGDIETVADNQGLHLASREGRMLVLLADSEYRHGLFLLADPEERTVRAISRRRLDRKVTLSEACELVNSIVIKAPAGQPDIRLDPTAAEASWVQKNCR